MESAGPKKRMNRMNNYSSAPVTTNGILRRGLTRKQYRSINHANTRQVQFAKYGMTYKIGRRLSQALSLESIEMDSATSDDCKQSAFPSEIHLFGMKSKGNTRPSLGHEKDLSNRTIDTETTCDIDDDDISDISDDDGSLLEEKIEMKRQRKIQEILDQFVDTSFLSLLALPG